MDPLVDQTVVLTVGELRARIEDAYVVWLIGGRGEEGMTVGEVGANLRRLPTALWLAIACHDITLAATLLKDVDCLPQVPDDPPDVQARRYKL